LVYSGHSVTGVRAYSLKESGGSYALSAHFQLWEFACKDGSDVVLVHPVALYLLEDIRRRVGKALHLNSAYRTVSYNAAITDSASGSAHIYGLADDIWASGVPPSVIADLAENLGVGGLGRYSTFTHVDIMGHHRRW
jgi:uncharacterized protein YcbK (DUF882 family)